MVNIPRVAAGIAAYYSHSPANPWGAANQFPPQRPECSFRGLHYAGVALALNVIVKERLWRQPPVVGQSTAPFVPRRWTGRDCGGHGEATGSHQWTIMMVNGTNNHMVNGEPWWNKNNKPSTKTNHQLKNVPSINDVPSINITINHHLTMNKRVFLKIMFTCSITGDISGTPLTWVFH